MRRVSIRGLLFLMVVLAVSGCATTGVPLSVNDDLSARLVFVGVTPDYAPVIFKTEDKQITGIEADFAQLLAADLGRPVKFVELAWDRLIPALIEGRIDIIMWGMTRNEARSVRVAFTDAYFKGGLMAAMRVEDAGLYPSVDRVLQCTGTVGVVKGTTGEIFARKNFPRAKRIATYPKASDGPFELKRNSIDLFVHDAPSIIWLVSEHETEIKGLWEFITVEELAWAVRRNDMPFLAEVNQRLAVWKEQGIVRDVLSRWLPYAKNLD